jgi:hypothetical protein
LPVTSPPLPDAVFGAVPVGEVVLLFEVLLDADAVPLVLVPLSFDAVVLLPWAHAASSAAEASAETKLTFIGASSGVRAPRGRREEPAELPVWNKR